MYGGYIESDFVCRNSRCWQDILTFSNCKFHTTCRNYFSKIYNWHNCHIVVLAWV